MAQLLRIAPQAPNLDLRVAQVPPSGLQYAGKALSDIGETLFKLEDGADRANAAKVAGDIKATWDAKLTELNDTVTDPQEFESRAVEEQQKALDTQIESGRSERAKTRIRETLSNDQILHTGRIQHLGREKTRLKALGDYESESLRMIDSASKAEDPAEREAMMKGYAHFTGYMTARGFIRRDQAELKIKKFTQQVAENRFYNTLEVNPSLALKQLKAGEFGEVEPEKRRQWEVQANQTIRQGILDQERELKLERDKADLNIQKMIDAGATAIQIENKLKAYTEAGIWGFEERDKIQQRLLRPTKDTPEQIANSQKLLADFNGDFYTAKRVSDYRAMAKQMRDNGEIGSAGSASFTGHLNQIQQALIREARVAVSEERRENPQITMGEAARKIGENYPYESATDSTKWSKGHREDVKAYNDLVQGKPSANKLEAATKVRDERIKTNQLKKANRDVLKALPADEQAALNALNPQPSKANR